MKTCKKALSLILAATMILSFTGCGSKKFSHDKVAKFARDNELTEFDDAQAICDEMDTYLYVCKCFNHSTGDDAQIIYDHLVNTFDYLPFLDPVETSVFYIDDKFGYDLTVLMTFESEEDAQTFFDGYSDVYMDNGETGEMNGYTYAFFREEYDERSDGSFAVYICGDMVLVIETIVYNPKHVNDFCDTFGVASPYDF